MSIKFSFSEAELADLMTCQDMSDLLAAIDVVCFRLDFYELAKWWDYRMGRKKLTHPAVRNWMDHYGFESTRDMPSGAIRAMYVSLNRYLYKIEKGESPPETLPTAPIRTEVVTDG